MVYRKYVEYADLQTSLIAMFLALVMGLVAYAIWAYLLGTCPTCGLNSTDISCVLGACVVGLVGIVLTVGAVIAAIIAIGTPLGGFIPEPDKKKRKKSKGVKEDDE